MMLFSYSMIPTYIPKILQNAMVWAILSILGNIQFTQQGLSRKFLSIILEKAVKASAVGFNCFF
jgi:hypothetical protein